MGTDAGVNASAPFDAAADTYDAQFTETLLGRRLRAAAWRWLDRAFGPGDRVLELGCGTGADAAHLAERGVRVIATDASDRMLTIARHRVTIRDANDLVTVAPLDAAQIGTDGWSDGLEPPFDGVLSDFGGLNCVPDRVRLLRGLAEVVRPGGRMVLVVMGPLCPWEIGWHLLHAEPRVAARRWRSGARAGVGEGATIRVWYPSAGRVAREAAPWFSVERLGGIGIALPPSGLSPAMERRAWLQRAAAPLEGTLARTRLGAALGDHWVMELRRRGG
jgi:SAM-dependent methyltransferase